MLISHPTATPFLSDFNINRKAILFSKEKEEQSFFETYNKDLLNPFPEAIMDLSNRARRSESFKNTLFRFIEFSKLDQRASNAAANAITILNQSGISLSRRDFRGIAIRGANLSSAILSGTNFSHADLRDVRLDGATLDYSTIGFSQVERLKLARRPINKLQQIEDIHKISWSPCVNHGKYIRFRKDNESIYLGDFLIGKETFIDAHDYVVNAVAISFDGLWAASGGKENLIYLWHCSSGRQKLCLIDNSSRGHVKGVASIAISKDGNKIISGYHDNTIRVWDSHTGERLHLFVVRQEVITCLAISEDGQRFLSGSEDHTVCLFNSQTGQELFYLRGHLGPITCASFSPNEQMILSGSSDATLKLWDSNTGQLLLNLEGHQSAVTCLVFSMNGQWILSGDEKGIVRWWDVETGELLGEFLGHTQAVIGLAFTPNLDVGISVGRDNKINRWTLNQIEHYYIRPKISYELGQRKISSADLPKLLEEQSKEFSLFPLDRNDRQRFIGLKKDLVGFSLSPDKKNLLAIANDHNIELWDYSSGSKLFSLKQEHRISHCYFLDERHILFETDYPSIQLWHIFDQERRLRPAVILSTHPHLSAQELNLEGVVGLSEENQALLIQLGASLVRQEESGGPANKALVNGKNQFPKIPLEVLYQLFSCLDLKEIKISSLVNRLFASISTESKIRRLNLGLPIDKLQLSDDAYKNFLEKHGEKIRYLDIYNLANAHSLVKLCPTVVVLTLKIDHWQLEHFFKNRLTALRNLQIPLCDVGDDGLRIISESNINLETINLRLNSIGEPGITLLANSHKFINLQSLDLSHNNIGPEKGLILVKPGFRSLTYLNLSSNYLGDNVVNEMALSENFIELTNLNLCNNRISDKGLEGFAKTIHLINLQILNVSFNEIGDSGVDKLITSKLWGTLKTLNISSNNKISLLGKTALKDAQENGFSIDVIL